MFLGCYWCDEKFVFWFFVWFWEWGCCCYWGWRGCWWIVGGVNWWFVFIGIVVVCVVNIVWFGWCLVDVVNFFWDFYLWLMEVFDVYWWWGVGEWYFWCLLWMIFGGLWIFVGFLKLSCWVFGVGEWGGNWFYWDLWKC